MPLTGSVRPEGCSRAIEAVLPRLSETFTFVDICGLLGHTPNCGSLCRVLQKLKVGEQLTGDFPGSGTQPARYRKVTATQEGSGS
jgi:hypothetical protein